MGERNKEEAEQRVSAESQVTGDGGPARLVDTEEISSQVFQRHV